MPFKTFNLNADFVEFSGPHHMAGNSPMILPMIVGAGFIAFSLAPGKQIELRFPNSIMLAMLKESADAMNPRT